MRLKTILAAGLLCFGIGASAQDFYLDRSRWTWSTSSDCQPEDTDIAGIDAIADGDNYTCWHSNWHAADGSPERRNPHWVKIDRGSDNSAFYGISYLPRQTSPNTACTSWALYLLSEDPGDIDATSEATIIAALGKPDYTGTWEGSTDEKTFILTGTGLSLRRYIVFVNLKSHSSSSAACAEFNLLTEEGALEFGSSGGGTVTPDPTPDPAIDYNALRITPISGTPHRIAIDGTNLSIAMNNGAIRLGNSGIAVEYSPAEVRNFAFEQYEFPEASPYYTGTKSPADAARFDMAVDPVDGSVVPAITEITLSNPAGTLPQVNKNCVLPVTLSRETSNSTTIKVSVTPAELATMVKGNAYVISGLTETKLANYILRVPADLFIDENGALSNEIVANYQVSEDQSDKIEETECPTVTLNRSGDTLIIGGLDAGCKVTVYNPAGMTMAAATANSRGVASVSVGALAKGAYILSANSITLKIIL